MGFTFISSPQFRAWRDELTTRLTWFTILLGVPTVIYAYFWSPDPGWDIAILVAVVGFNAVVGLVPGAGGTLRAASLVLLLFVPSILITLEYGVTGGSRLYMAAAVLLAGSLLGPAAGYSLLGLSLAVLGGIGAFVLQHPGFVAAESAELSARSDWWIWFALSFGITTGVSLLVVLFLLQRMVDSLEAEHARTSELETANRQLTELQDRFHSLETYVSDVIWMMDLDRNLTYISPSAEKVLGITQAERESLTIFNISSERDQVNWRSLFDQALQREIVEEGSAGPVQFISQMVHKDGRLIDVEIRASFLRDKTGRPTGIVGVTRPITDRIQLNAMVDAVLSGTARSQGVDFFESLVTNISRVLNVDMVLVGSLHEEDMTVHTKAVYRFGQVAENFVYNLSGSPCEQVLSGGICVYPKDVKDLFLEDKGLMDMGIESYIGSPLLDESGKAIGLIAALNRTEIKDLALAEKLLGVFGNQACAELIRENDQQEKQAISQQLQRMQRIESIGLLAGGVAHDFNNLLMVISGYLEMLELRNGHDDDARSAYREMRSATDRATALTRQLLTFSRRQVMEKKPVDLNEMVDSLSGLFERLLTANIDYQFTPSEQSAIVNGDVSQLEQSVVNARDAMPEGGELLIEVGRAQIDEEYVDAHPWAEVGEYVTVSVQDSGEGMTESVQERIFEPFFTTKAVDEGTGLGLSVYFGVVKQHSGFTQLYSEPGHGNRVMTFLPAVEGVPESEEEPGRVKEQTGNEFVLIVEDNAQVRRLSESMLIQKGYRVATAVDGEEAMEQYQRYRGELSLIVLDVVLPKENGDLVMQKIRETGDDVPILFTSGYAPGGIHTEFVLNDNIEFIQKPFKPTELMHKIREMLDATSAP